MGTPTRIISCAIVLICLAALLAGCRAGRPITTPTSAIPAMGSLQDKDIADAIILAGDKTNWIITPVKPGLMAGWLGVRGKHSVEVEIVYNNKEYTIRYKNSGNMTYNAEEGTIHPSYNSWVATLDMNIRRELAKLPRR